MWQRIRESKQVRNVVGPQVRRTRSKNELSQAELAARLQLAGMDVSRVAVAKIEMQIREATDAELFILINARLKLTH